jgi:NADP-dependent 3-hydroxy acid dehydrogenase YdfG
MKKTAVVTGASSGIGAAAAVRLAEAGFEVVLGARRVDRLREVAQKSGGRALHLDVTDMESITRFAGQIERVDVLVNNAGLASGFEPVADLSYKRLHTMWATNVAGLVRVTQAFMDKLETSGQGHIVNIGSIAGIEVYPGGAGYTASKHAVRAITRTLRFELLGKPIRITEIAPGLVETEFALVRFDGDTEKAAKPYEGMTPLTSNDIADCIVWAVTRPAHVNIDEIVVRPLAQASATQIARDG